MYFNPSPPEAAREKWSDSPGIPLQSAYWRSDGPSGPLPPILYPSELHAVRPLHSANPHLCGPFPRCGSPRGLLGLLALSALLTACGDDSSEPDQPRRPVITEATQRTLDSIFTDPSAAELAAVAAQPRIVAPEIGFPKSSGDLPTGGTWREHPLLADFDGDGHLDLVATNREEDGLNIWRGDGQGGWTHAVERCCTSSARTTRVSGSPRSRTSPAT